MTTADEPAGAHVRSERHGFWERSLHAWDLAFYLMIAVATVTILVKGPAGVRLVVAVAALGGLVVSYLLVGRTAARTGDPGRALVYLALLVTLTGAIVLAVPVGTILLFLAYSQIWFFASTRVIGVVGCVVLTTIVFGALAANLEPGPDLLPNVLTEGGLSLTFAVLLGLWVTQIAEQSEERAELLAQLEAAQEELAGSHHAAGVAAERERMAGEIHDTLAQGFTSIVMLAQAATADVRRGESERATDRLDLVERTARDNLAEARALVAAFSPVGLDDATLGEALTRLAERFEHETGVSVTLVSPDPADAPALSRDREVILLRAAQEALSNVRRHASARHVQLVLRAGDDGGPGGAVELEVVDDGQGFDAAHVAGIGLTGMRERVASGGGALDVTSSDRGTRLRVSLPTPDATKAAP